MLCYVVYTFIILVYIFIGIYFWVMSNVWAYVLASNDKEKLDVLIASRPRFKRMFFLAKIDRDNVVNYWKPWLILIYPFYMAFGWTPIMYSYVFSSSDTSEFLEKSELNPYLMDIFGQDAKYLRELESGNVFNKYKMPLDMQENIRGSKK